MNQATRHAVNINTDMPSVPLTLDGSNDEIFQNNKQFQFLMIGWIFFCVNRAEIQCRSIVTKKIFNQSLKINKIV